MWASSPIHYEAVTLHRITAHYITLLCITFALHLHYTYITFTLHVHSIAYTCKCLNFGRDDEVLSTRGLAK